MLGRHSACVSMCLRCALVFSPEMEEYLGRPQVEQTEDFDLLAWWKDYEHRAPNLARMAKQVHGAPITSAGVERVFSSAGMLHGDKSKQQDVGLLKALLFASYY